MKKQTLMLSLLLFLHGVLPVGCGAAWAWDWTCVISEPVFPLLLALVTAILTACLKGGEPSLLAVLLYPASILNGLLCLWYTDGLLAIPAVAVWVICCGILFRELASINIWRKLTAFLSGLLVTALILLSALTAFVGVMTRITVVQQVDSPNGTFTAQLIDADHGATGGDTLVKVWDNSRLVHLGLVWFTAEPRAVYRGDWGEFMDMTLSWQDDATLLINERAYPIG